MRAGKRSRAASAALGLSLGLGCSVGATGAEAFGISSPDVVDGKIGEAQWLSEPYGFGCSGGNASPRLSWSDAPQGTKSFVLTVRDLDAPTGIGWTHWVVANIPAATTQLAGGVSRDGTGLPAGALQTRTDFGVPGYGGPCPPKDGQHRYVFTLTALGVDKLPDAVTGDATPALVGFFARSNALGEAALTVSQGR